MPFWWQRRRKFWRGRWRQNYKRRFKTYRKKRYFRRHKYRRPTRRRRRRRKKVRRKFKAIPLKQWQPKYIVKCTIRGLHLFLLGAEGRQFSCYTDEQFIWTPAKAPGGGGFSAESYSLQWLYNQYKEGRCYWSKSNSSKDLCRYTGCSFILYKHNKIDFLIYYTRKPTSKPDKYHYSNLHPFQLLLRKRTKVLHRTSIHPNSRIYKKIKIKPPRTLQNNWYAQSEFAEQQLVELNIVAVDLINSYISRVDTNQLITAYSLSTQFYPKPNWGHALAETTPWMPRPNQKRTLTPRYGAKEGQPITIPENYSGSISWDKGWFQKGLLLATSIKDQNVVPVIYLRYNPKIDDGHGNQIYVKHITQTDYLPPTSDKAVLLEDRPLWQLLFGYVSYLQKIKPHENILEDYILCIVSPAIYPFTKNIAHVPLDNNFINGKAPYEQELSAQMLKLWFPKLLHQQQFINSIVECGPYIPKLGRERESSWDLHGKYSFYFKWGGEDTDYQDAYDPSRQTNYAISNNLAEAIQVSDPSKQIPSTLPHAWDYRRGILTNTAIKRIRENLPTDETISTDSEPVQKKKKVLNSIPFYNQKEEEIQECLQELYKESTFQAPETEEQLINLIQEQQQQQNHLKRNLLYLIEELKKQQTKLKLKTGILH